MFQYMTLELVEAAKGQVPEVAHPEVSTNCHLQAVGPSPNSH
jgi:hypothetical protein